LARKFRGSRKLRPLLPLAVGSIKQHGIAFDLPNGGQFHAARSVQTENHATGMLIAYEDAFRDVKGSNF
jgi:hypothetical protein